MCSAIPRLTGPAISYLLDFSVWSAILEKLVTIYHAQHYIREFIPVDKEFPGMPIQLGYQWSADRTVSG